MDDNIYISFISEGSQHRVQIPLSRNSGILIAEDILKTKWHVQADLKYSAEISGIESIEKVDFYLNGEKKEILLDKNRIYFLKNNIPDGGIFSDLLGFARVSVCIVYEGGNKNWFYSDYISILVLENTDNQHIDKMLKYIYENQKDLFYRKSLHVENGKFIGEEKFDDFYSQLVLIEKITHVYEENFGYFKANSRARLEPVRVIADANRIQYVDEGVISYVVQHPEHLREEASGIKFSRRTFLPEKTLMVQNKFTRNIYENQVIVGFLGTLLRSILDLKRKIKGFLDETKEFQTPVDGYIASAFIFYKYSICILRSYMEQLEEHEKKLQTLSRLYKMSLMVTEQRISVSPQPSAIFMSVPQYNRIFICIQQWFRKSGYELKNEKQLTYLFDKYTIYEFYVLSKLIRGIKNMGFLLKSASAVNYPKMEGWKYQNQDCNNTFLFVNEDGRELTLYYEPLIYVGGIFTNEITGLYRNNTVSLNSDKDMERRGTYYVPDYVLKYYDGKRNRFMICDAKLSSKNTVRAYHVPELSFKYLLSISCVHQEDQYVGMTIFYEKSKETSIETFYDKQGENPIKPYILIVPVTENIPEANQEQLIQEIIGRFLNAF